MRTPILLLLTAAAALAGCGFEPMPEREMVWRDGKWVPGPMPAEGTPEGEMALIHWYAGREDHAKVVEVANRFVERYRDDPRAERAMLLAGEAELLRKRYLQAHEWFDRQLTGYPVGRHFERALAGEMKVAEAFLAGEWMLLWGWLGMPAEDKGLDILLEIAEHAPGSKIADRALRRIGDWRFDRGEYGEAAEAYDNYLAVFPKAQGAAHAMFRAAQAAYAMYRGPRFDVGPLIEADIRFRGFVEAFPARARRWEVPAILGEIAERFAGKDFEAARLYERIGRPDAAAFYYGEVLSEYPDTSWAPRARRELNRLEPAPPRPGEGSS